MQESESEITYQQLDDDRIPLGISISYSMNKPKISEVEEFSSSIFRDRGIIKFGNGGSIMFVRGGIYSKNLPKGIKLLIDGVEPDIYDMTKPEDLASLDVTPEAGEIRVGFDLPGLKTDNFSSEEKYRDQIIPSIYGDLVLISEIQIRDTLTRWSTIDKKVIIGVETDGKKVVFITDNR